MLPHPRMPVDMKAWRGSSTVWTAGRKRASCQPWKPRSRVPVEAVAVAGAGEAERRPDVAGLKGAQDATSAAFFRNMTQRAGELLKEEITMLGSVRRSEIESARMELVDLARTLMERGDIRTGRREDEDELVE